MIRFTTKSGAVSIKFEVRMTIIFIEFAQLWDSSIIVRKRIPPTILVQSFDR